MSAGPKATGCLITDEDYPRLYASITSYVAQMGNGTCNALLALSINHLSMKFGLSPAEMGSIFIFVGIGYFSGLYLSLKILDSTILSKPVLTCTSAYIYASAFGLVYEVNNLVCLKLLVFIMYTMCGSMENFTIISLSEIWGQRVQPWLNARLAVYFIGAVFPTLVVQSIGVVHTARVGIVILLSSIIGIVLDLLTAYCRGEEIILAGELRDCDTEGEAAPLIRGRTRTTSSVQQPDTRFRRLSNAADEVIMSEELVVLEFLLEDQIMRGAPSLLKYTDESTEMDLASSVLDATEYCNVSPKCRLDPMYEPAINRTLAYATPRMVQAIESGMYGIDKDITHDNAFPTDKNKDQEPAIGIFLLPSLARLLLVVMFFFYQALLITMNSWLPSFSDDGTTALSVWYMSITIGCVVSTPLSLFISTSSLLRMQLGLVTVGLFVLIGWGMRGGSWLFMGCSIVGFGLSSVSPLALTFVNDYGYTMDKISTTYALMGVSLSTIIVPVMVGTLMAVYGKGMLLVCAAFFGVSMILVYLLVHLCLSRSMLHKSKEDPTSPTHRSRGNSYQRARASSVQREAIEPIPHRHSLRSRSRTLSNPPNPSPYYLSVVTTRTRTLSTGYRSGDDSNLTTVRPRSKGSQPSSGADQRLAKVLEGEREE